MGFDIEGHKFIVTEPIIKLPSLLGISKYL